MNIAVQAESLNGLREALKSRCTAVRFGAEFCDLKIPELETLKEAYGLAFEHKKDFTYVTPRASNLGLEKIRRQLPFLNENKAAMVINDLGTLNMLEDYPGIRRHLGRQLVFTPSRCPWPQFTSTPTDFLTKRKVAKLFYQTSLNYEPTIAFLKKYDIIDIDVDWLPECFPSYAYLKQNGLRLSVHVGLVPVSVTRRCHTARFLGETDPQRCSRPCTTRAFTLKHRIVETNYDLMLSGNVVFSLVKPSQRDARKLSEVGVSEFVIAVNPVTRIESHEKIDQVISNLAIE